MGGFRGSGFRGLGFRVQGSGVDVCLPGFRQLFGFGGGGGGGVGFRDSLGFRD